MSEGPPTNPQGQASPHATHRDDAAPSASSPPHTTAPLPSRLLHAFLWLATVVLVFNLLVIGQSLIIPLVLAFFAWYLINTLNKLTRSIRVRDWRPPRWLAFTLSAVLVVGVLIGLAMLIHDNVNKVQQKAPEYRQRIVEINEQIKGWLPDDISESMKQMIGGSDVDTDTDTDADTDTDTDTDTGSGAALAGEAEGAEGGETGMGPDEADNGSAGTGSDGELAAVDAAADGNGDGNADGESGEGHGDGSANLADGGDADTTAAADREPDEATDDRGTAAIQGNRVVGASDRLELGTTHADTPITRPGDGAAAPSLADRFRNVDFTGLLQAMAATLGSFAGSAALVLAYLFFIFLEQRFFDAKLRMLIKDEKRRTEVQGIIAEIDRDIRSYIGVKTLVSVLTAGLSYIIMKIAGLDFAEFWAVLLFVFNYIPNIGSLVATALPAALALIQLDLAWFLVVAIGITGVQLAMANLVEPNLMGKSLNQSPLVVFLSLVLWGTLWGVAGMFLCVPITVVVMIVLSHFPQTRWVPVALSLDGRVRGDPEVRRVEQTHAPTDADAQRLTSTV